ncbi:hypothetical protein GPEL0_01f2178 [Geoanaerobacter pelophilus]|uniref:Uncharacterized protein n=1 Tax=Geoanaerobacter pelophilus TaxID=60036 RepID=A0ABQ0MIR6_9BACT|nr:hypothetical protein GPEL0_01f2178 [Geoanaerobacter pelophilus]
MLRYVLNVLRSCEGKTTKRSLAAVHCNATCFSIERRIRLHSH